LIGLREVRSAVGSRSESGSRGRGLFKEKCNAFRSQIELV
jgi:hypothetical protein